MVELMLQELHPVRYPGETDASVVAQLLSVIRTQIGRATIYQMIRLAEEIQRRGGTPRDPAEVEKDFDARLCRLVASRRDSVARGIEPVDRFLVPGVQRMLDALRQQGISLVLLSGTRLVDLQEEAEFLGIADYFDGGIFGPGTNPEEFCKGRVIAEIAARQPGGAAAIVGYPSSLRESAGGNSTLGDGYRVEARITIDELPHALLIPNSALFRHQREWHVLKIVDDKAALQRVAIGLQNESHSQVTKGLAQGDQVIVYPSDDLSPGTKVRLVRGGTVVTPPAQPSE